MGKDLVRGGGVAMNATCKPFAIVLFCLMFASLGCLVWNILLERPVFAWASFVSVVIAGVTSAYAWPWKEKEV